MKVDTNVSFRAGGFPKCGELLRYMINKSFVLDDACGSLLGRTRLERSEPLCPRLLDALGSSGVRVDTDPLARGASQKFINRNTQSLALDVP